MPPRLSRLSIAILMLLAAVPRARADQLGITVSGSGQVKSKPTEVEIGALISGEAELTNDAMVKYRDAKKRALAAIEGLKLANLSIESTGISISQALDPNAQQMMMQGRAANIGKPKVQASESLKITLKGVDKLGADALMDIVMKVIDTGRDAGLQIGPPTPTNYYQMQMEMQSGQSQGMLQFKINDATSQREDAYKKAMEDAKSKAQRLADLAGVKLGGIISIHDSVAVKGDAGNAVPWMNPYGMGTQTDPSDLTFDLLRTSAADAPVKLNQEPIATATHWIDTTAELGKMTLVSGGGLKGKKDRHEQNHFSERCRSQPPEPGRLGICDGRPD